MMVKCTIESSKLQPPILSLKTRNVRTSMEDWTEVLLIMKDILIISQIKDTKGAFRVIINCNVF